MAAELKIGVARREDGLAAHAWVERRGQPVGEASSVEQHFAALGSAGALPQALDPAVQLDRMGE